MAPLDPAIARLEAARQAYAALRPRVDAGAPWPLAAHFGVEPEASWGPPEVLAHVTEMLPFWLGELERVLDGVSEPVPFGRIATDPVRLGVIERDRTLPLRELWARLDSGIDRYVRRLPDFDDAAVGRRGLHATLGEMTVEQLLERFVVAHLEDHVAQLRTSLDAA
jgi:hypothetical protein